MTAPDNVVHLLASNVETTSLCGVNRYDHECIPADEPHCADSATCVECYRIDARECRVRMYKLEGLARRLYGFMGGIALILTKPQKIKAKTPGAQASTAALNERYREILDSLPSVSDYDELING